MRRAHAIALALVPAALAVLLSCGGAAGHAPVGRLSLMPRFVCGGDNHLTVVRMDAALSADPVDDPPEKALPCSADADCAGGRVCTDTGAPPDAATGARRTLCLHPLKYVWEIEDETFVKTDGDYAGVMIAGTFNGDRPYRVTLTVTDRDGDRHADFCLRRRCGDRRARHQDQHARGSAGAIFCRGHAGIAAGRRGQRHHRIRGGGVAQRGA